MEKKKVQLYEVDSFKNKILGDYSDGLIAVSNKEALGNQSTVRFMNKKGKIEIETDYYDADTKFVEGLAPVANSNRGYIQYGFINKSKKVEIPFTFDYARPISEARAAVKKNGKWGFIRSDGRYLTSFRFDEVRDFKNGVAAVRIGNKWSCINPKGEEIFRYIFDDVLDYFAGLLPVKKNGKYGYINLSKETIIDFEYDEAKNFSHMHSIAPVKKNGKWGFINPFNELVVDYQYDDARSFSEGLAAVSKDGKCGYIDEKGNLAIDLKYDGASDFSDGIALVCLSNIINVGLDDSNTYKLITNEGEELSRFITEEELKQNEPCDILSTKTLYVVEENGVFLSSITEEEYINSVRSKKLIYN